MKGIRSAAARGAALSPPRSGAAAGRTAFVSVMAPFPLLVRLSESVHQVRAGRRPRTSPERADRGRPCLGRSADGLGERRRSAHRRAVDRRVRSVFIPGAPSPIYTFTE
ncbi:hypothetical protein GCM10009605_60430 [Nocardiopsis composta]